MIAEADRREFVWPAVTRAAALVEELARYDGDQPVRSAGDVAALIPAAMAAPGEVVLASLPDDELEDRLGRVRELPVFTAKSHRTPEALRRDPETRPCRR